MKFIKILIFIGLVFVFYPSFSIIKIPSKIDDNNLKSPYSKELRTDTINILEDRLLQIRDTCNDCLDEMITLNLLAVEYMNHSPLVALNYAFESLDIAFRINNNYEIYDVYSTIGRIYHEQGLYNEAIEYFEKTLLFFKDAKDFKTYPWSYVNIGNVLYAKEDFVKSKEYYNKALDLFYEINDSYGQATSYDNIGLIFISQGDLDSALIYFNKSLDIRIRLGDKSDIAFSYKYVADIYLLKKQYTESYNYYLKALNLYEQNKDDNGKASLLSKLGDLFISKNEYSRAFEYYLMSIELYKILDDNVGLSKSYFTLANVYYSIQDYENAVNYCNECYLNAKKNGLLTIQQDALEILYKIYAEKEDYKNAFEYHQLYFLLKDSIKSERVSQRILQLEVKSTYDEHKRELELMSKENKIKELEIKKRTNLIYYFIISSIVLLIVVLSNMQKFSYRIKLAKQFSFGAAILSKIGLIFLSAIYLTSALYIIQPFGIGNLILKERLILFGGLGLITAIIMLGSFILFYFIEKILKSEKFDTYKYIAFILLIIIGISCLGWIFTKNYRLEEQLSMNFYDFVLIIISLVMFPVFFIILFIEKIHLKRQEKITKVISHHLSNIEEPEFDELFVIKSDKSKEEIELLLSQFLCVEAKGNYSKIFYLKNNKLNDKMMLISLKSIEEQLEKYEKIIRCHKSFIVNKNKISHISGNSQRYKINFKELRFTIPVSRSFSKSSIKDIKHID